MAAFHLRPETDSSASKCPDHIEYFPAHRCLRSLPNSIVYKNNSVKKEFQKRLQASRQLTAVYHVEWLSSLLMVWGLCQVYFLSGILLTERPTAALFWNICKLETEALCCAQHFINNLTDWLRKRATVDSFSALIRAQCNAKSPFGPHSFSVSTAEDNWCVCEKMCNKTTVKFCVFQVHLPFFASDPSHTHREESKPGCEYTVRNVCPSWHYNALYQLTRGVGGERAGRGEDVEMLGWEVGKKKKKRELFVAAYLTGYEVTQWLWHLAK